MKYASDKWTPASSSPGTCANTVETREELIMPPGSQLRLKDAAVTGTYNTIHIKAV